MGRHQTHRVNLKDEERDELRSMIRKGNNTRKLTRARVLLLADEGKKDKEISEFLHINGQTAANIRKRYATQGFERALHDAPRPGRSKTLDTAAEAQLIALTCSDPPEGYARWELRLLADKLVELGVVESVSHETIRTTLKKTTSSPGKFAPGVSQT